MKELTVIYSCDDNYAQHTTISLISLCINNRDCKINVYIINNNISSLNINLICKSLDKYECELHFVDFGKYEKQLELNMPWAISISSYARLFSTEILPDDIDKVLYVDSDTIFCDKITDLFLTDISDYGVAGVLDLGKNISKRKIGLADDDLYINAGVMLINVAFWRKNNVLDVFLDYIKKNNGTVWHHDQGIINAVLRSKIKLLPIKYNVMSPIFMLKYRQLRRIYQIDSIVYSETEVKNVKQCPVILHFTPAFTTRPWERHCKHPRKNEYKKYLNVSAWTESDMPVKHYLRKSAVENLLKVRYFFGNDN